MPRRNRFVESEHMHDANLTLHCEPSSTLLMLHLIKEVGDTIGNGRFLSINQEPSARHDNMDYMRIHLAQKLVTILLAIFFISAPYVWQWWNATYGHQTTYADWSAWWTFGTFLLAVIAAFIAWQEYQEAWRPRLMVRLSREYERLYLLDGKTEIAEYTYLRVNNIGGSVACGISVTFTPGIPWPDGSHPAGDPQRKLEVRKRSYMAANDGLTVLEASQDAFDKVAFEEKHAHQTVTLEYCDSRRCRYKESYDIDLREISFVPAIRV